MAKKINGIDVEKLKAMKDMAIAAKAEAPKKVPAKGEPKLCIAIAGLETRKTKQGRIKHCWTFYNNCMTWVKDLKGNHVRIVDARDFVEDPHPIRSIMSHLGGICFDHGPIDKLMISSHSDWEGLYIISKSRTNLPEPDRYILPYTKWDGIEFSPDAAICLQGCQTAGQRGNKMKECICQDLADNTDVLVYGYACKAAQKLRNGGYYPVPDIGGLIEFKPRVYIPMTSASG